MVHNHKTAEEVSYFKVEVGFASEEGEGPFSIPDGIWYGLAKDEASAENLAYEQCWDRRLTSVSCSPVFNCEKLPRYFSCAAWGHPFVGNREEITRFIYDCAKKSLVAAQVRNGRAWIKMCIRDRSSVPTSKPSTAWGDSKLPPSIGRSVRQMLDKRCLRTNITRSDRPR